jgi:ATP-binding cassette subfamily A (ABC1) protein 3
LPGAGLQWSTINKPVNVDDNFTMLYTLLMLILDIILYSLITWYFDALLPGDFGTPQPFYFPFTVSASRSCMLLLGRT